jgi:hypothetical protein
MYDLTDKELYAVDYLYGVGTEDVALECRSLGWVKIRYPQKCVSVLHKGKMTQLAGTRMVAERAKVEGKFGTCYTCEPCVKAAAKDMDRH